MRRVPVLAAALAGVLGLTSACGGGTDIAAIDPPGAAPVACGTINLALNPSVGYQANLAVVSYLAKERLGCTVNEVEQSPEDSWKGIEAGSIDAILENWGHDAQKIEFIDQKRVAVIQGVTGNEGAAGWYVPPWLAAAYPAITDHKNLNDFADMLQTTKSGAQGQFLAVDAASSATDAALIANLGLDYKVVYAGSEDALIKAFERAEKNRIPLLGHFYAPQWFLAEVPLVKVGLPPHTPGCDDDPARVKCDYRPYDLDKIARKAFAESGNPAAELIKNFEWSNDEQNEVARLLTVDKLSRDDAAKRWLDANGDVWQDWLPQ